MVQDKDRRLIHVPAPGSWTQSTPTLLRVSCQFTVDPSSTVRALKLATVVPRSDTRAAGSGLAALTGGSTCTGRLRATLPSLTGIREANRSGRQEAGDVFHGAETDGGMSYRPSLGAMLVDPTQRSCVIGRPRAVYVNLSKGKSPCRHWTKTRVPSAIAGHLPVRRARWTPSKMRGPAD